MPIRDGAVIRRERLMMILQLVKSNPGITIAKIQTDIAWRTGLTSKTVSKYVSELNALGKIVQKNQGFSVPSKH